MADLLSHVDAWIPISDALLLIGGCVRKAIAAAIVGVVVNRVWEYKR